MADTKISALPASTTPLAGTEVLPIVQSGVTRQVSVANLTAGRTVGTSQLNADTGSGAALAAIFNSSSVNGAYLQGRSSGNIIWDIGTTANLFSGGTTTDFGLTSRGGSLVLGTGSTRRLTLNSSGDATINTSGRGFVLPGGISWTSGAGSPEGVVTAPVGSLYSRSDGGLLTSLYVKESGSGNTGWAGK
jgi:hypothetical protein